MQGLRLRRHSQTLSRRKLQFDESKLGHDKRLRRIGPALLKETPNVECGSYANELSSLESEQKQETGLSKLAAIYRRRRPKQVQEIRNENFDNTPDLTSVTVQNGVSTSLKGSSTQSSKIVDVSHIDEHGLQSVSMLKRVSKAVKGSSKRKHKDANVVHHVQSNEKLNLVQANSSALSVVIQEPSLPDPNMGIANSLDVVPFDEGLLLHAVDTAIVYQGPFPSFSRPSQEECSEVCYRLSQLHGPLEEYAKHKIARISEKQVLALEYHKEEDSKTIKDVLHGPHSAEVKEGFPSGHPKERHTVLDSLVGTMLSQNTTDTNSRRAFASLKTKFPTWEAVYGADPKDVEDAIRCGGLAEIKTSRILNILKILDQERGKLCLEYVRNLSVDEIKLELSRFKGVGPKTIACVLMFHLQQNEFPVDTHVFRITKMLGWVPAKADREKAYLHLNRRIPNHLKFDLHCLLVTHGKRCPRCAKGGRTQKPADGPCPLANLNLKFIEASPCDLLIES